MKEIKETEFMRIQEPLALILSIINGISSILGSFGNVSLISVILFHKQLRGASEMLLVSLGLTDFLSCAVYLPMLIIRLNATHKLSTVMNQTRRAIGQATAVSASLNLFMLTADQYVFFRCPLRYMKWMRKKVVITAIVVIHVIATTCGVFAYHDMERSQYLKTGVIGAALLAFFSLHFAIFRLATIQRNKVANQQLSLQHNYEVTAGAMRRAKRNLRTVMLFGILYFVTWLPVTIFQLWNSISKNNDTLIFQTYFYPLLTVQQISSFVDPFLYCYRNNKIKAVLLKIVSRKTNQVDISGQTAQQLSFASSKIHLASPSPVKTAPSLVHDKIIHSSTR